MLTTAVSSKPATVNTFARFALLTAILIPVIGIVLGHIALFQIGRTGEGGRGRATAALAIGYSMIAIGFVVGFVVGLAAELGVGGV